MRRCLANASALVGSAEVSPYSGSWQRRSRMPQAHLRVPALRCTHARHRNPCACTAHPRAAGFTMSHNQPSQILRLALPQTVPARTPVAASQESPGLCTHQRHTGRDIRDPAAHLMVLRLEGRTGAHCFDLPDRSNPHSAPPPLTSAAQSRGFLP